jgi:hypothetical protein
VIESEGPKTRREGGTKKHGTKGVTNGLVSTLNRAILMGRIGARGIDGVVKFLEESDDNRIVVQLTALIKDDIFVFDIRRMAFKPSTEPMERNGFGNTGHAIKGMGDMIGDQEITSFTGDASVSILSFDILGSLTGESKVTTKTLPRNGGFTSGVVASRLLTKFGSNTDRAEIKDSIVMFKSRYTINVPVGIEKIFITRMTKTLVPEKTFGTSIQVMKKEFRLDTRELTEVGPKGTKVAMMWGKVRSDIQGRGNRILREKKGFCITETTIKNARDVDSTGVAKLVVCRPMKSTGFGTFIESGARVLVGGKQALERTRRKNDRRNARGIVAKGGDKAKASGSRNVEETISLWRMGDATSVNKTCLARFVEWESFVAVEMTKAMSGGGLRTIIKMSANAIKVVVTKGMKVMNRVRSRRDGRG